MLGKWLNLLKPAPFIQPIRDKDEAQAQYHYWRIRICASLFFGYAIFYFTRKSFTFAAPAMAAELSLTKVDIGLLGSILYITYGISKFLSGVMSDRSNPRYFMAFGLIATGILNILFGMSSSFWLFAFFWGLNGWFQAWGWPSCCKSLTYWFKQSERGLWYSITSTSHNVGGALIPIIVAFCTMHFGWRYAMFVPALFSIAMGILLIERLRDVPQSLGLPAVEDKDKIPENPVTHEPNLLSAKEIMFNHVLNNRYVWIFAVSYFFVYVVRTAVNDWGMFYLMEEKGMSDIMSSMAISGFEVGGFFGMIAAGWGSDYFFKGNRIPTVILSTVGLISSIFMLWLIPQAHPYLDIGLISLIGFFVFGPQMIVGLAAAEFVDKRAAAASNGFAGTLGYFGAAAGCYVLGVAIHIWGWSGFYWSLLVSSFIILLLLIPFWSTQDPSKGQPDKPKANKAPLPQAT